jgi:hypothetical protein
MSRQTSPQSEATTTNLSLRAPIKPSPPQENKHNADPPAGSTKPPQTCSPRRQKNTKL